MVHFGSMVNAACMGYTLVWCAMAKVTITLTDLPQSDSVMCQCESDNPMPHLTPAEELAKDIFNYLNAEAPEGEPH